MDWAVAQLAKSKQDGLATLIFLRYALLLVETEYQLALKSAMTIVSILLAVRQIAQETCLAGDAQEEHHQSRTIVSKFVEI
jgi:hypothetical protein